ncbi:MAG: zinc-dependent alcohol dehydrogenase family protein [Pyrinomonadaceae bacterium]
MKAFEIQEFGIDKLSAVERDMPKLATDEILVKFHAASLNYRDVMIASGTYNPRMKLPATPLSDGAGEIIKVGENVSNWKPGDRVMPIFVQRWFDGESTDETRKTALGAGPQWDGVLREYAAFREDAIVKIPDHLSYAEAATLPCAALTAWNALVVSGRLRAGEIVLTLGTGGVSIFAIQFAKLFGAHVIATSSSDEKIEKLKALRADETINYRQTENWDKAVLELTNKRGVDHVIEVGGAGTLAKSINAARVSGHIAMIGALDTEGTFNHVPIFMKALRLQGIFIGSKAMFIDMLRAVEYHGLRPVIDKEFVFDQIRDALNYMQSGSHFGKIVIIYD